MGAKGGSYLSDVEGSGSLGGSKGGGESTGGSIGGPKEWKYGAAVGCDRHWRRAFGRGIVHTKSQPRLT